MMPAMTAAPLYRHGASGYLGRQVVAAWLTLPWRTPARIVARPARTCRPPAACGLRGGLRHPRAATGEATRDFEYDVDVNGTRRLLEACVQHGVKRIVVSSSGAAYGYHADNAPWLTEDMPVRGNAVFAYSHHKRLVEEMLADYRNDHPALEQVVLRIGTILGPTVRNQITDMFEKPRLLAIRGLDSPFVFIWDQDVVGIILRAVSDGPARHLQRSGDGALTIHEIARRLGKKTRVCPRGYCVVRYPF
jgi:UDP-glucose 4-epimerase